LGHRSAHLRDDPPTVKVVLESTTAQALT